MISKMKLHEALNLYSLHKNPEELTGHDKAQQSFLKPGKWAWYMSGEDPWETMNGNSPIADVRQHLNFSGDDVNIMPFNRQQFDKLIADQDDQNRYTRGEDPNLYDPATSLMKEYMLVRKKFLAAVSRMKSPATLMEFGYEYTGGFAVFEHIPDVVAMAFSQADEDEWDEDEWDEDEWDEDETT